MKDNKPRPSGAHMWFQELVRQYVAGLANVFLLTGNVSDIFPVEQSGEVSYLTIRQFLALQLAGREIAVFWDKSAGFVFADEIIPQPKSAEGEPERVSMREKFKTAVGVGQSQSANPLESLLGGGSAGSVFPTDPSKALPLLEQLLCLGGPEDKKAVVVIDYAESVVGENDYSSVPAVTIQRWAKVDAPFKNTGNPVILIERTAQRLSCAVNGNASGAANIHVPLPSRDELAGFISWAIPARGVKLAKGLDVSTAANLAAGLRALDLDDFFMEAVEADSALDAQVVWAKKAELIETSTEGVLQVMSPKHGFEALGGLDYVKSACYKTVAMLRASDSNADLGALFMGPPGTGKTLAAEALAKESGLPFCVLSSPKDKLVGESERRLALALEVLETMSPVICFIDEADGFFGDANGYQGDSGVSAGIRSTFQNFLSQDSHRGRIFVILNTNYPDRLPAALTRDGRMDLRVAFLPPREEAERLAIFSAMCAKYAQTADKLDFTAALQATAGWTGAEIEGLLRRAIQFAREEEVQLETRHLVEAVADFIPNRRNRGEYDEMVNAAISFCNSRRMLPPSYRSALAATPTQPPPAEKQEAVAEIAHRGGGRTL